MQSGGRRRPARAEDQQRGSGPPNNIPRRHRRPCFEWKTWRPATALSLALAAPFASWAQVGAQPEALNMRLAGYSDLQARTAYQPTIQKQGKRWIA